MPFSFVATCLLLILSTTLNATPPPADPVGYWAFDAADIDGSAVAEKSGSGATCHILEATLGTGRVGEALALDGDADGITINGLDVASKQIAVSMWIRRDSSVGARRLLNFCTSQLTGNRNVDTYFSKTTQVGFSGTELFVHSGKEGRADYNQPLVDPGIINGRWTHLVITWDTAAKSSNVQVYVDGKLRVRADLDKARDVEIKVRAIFVGHINDPDSLKQVFHGAIDELAVYDRVLTAEEIAAYHLAVNETHGAEAVIPFGQVIEIKSKAPEGPPYVPEPLFSGQRKLIRCASELCSRLLHSPSIAATDLPAKVKIWQDTGLDGMIFSMATHNPPVPARGTNMTGQWWGLEKRHYEEFEPEIKAFQSVEDWGRLTDNFLWSSYAVWWDGPRTRCQNWFNDGDWEILLHNIGLHARIAKECGFVGVLLDCEQYRGHHANGTWHIPFSYPVYREGSYKLDGEEAPRPFNEVRAQVRQRGFQYARTVCAAFPGARILILPGLYEWTARLGNGPLEQNHNGLFPAFLDGMLLGLDKNAMMIGGSELTYSKTDYRPIANVRKMYDDAIEGLCGVRALKRKLSFAGGIWADIGNWSDTDATVNSRDYNNHRRALQHAFMVSGEYAWLYGEKSFFLTTEPTDVMKGYFQANIDAHTFDGPPPHQEPKE
ncbi:MAG TPA: hypothetical protein DIT01_03315 [Lentisphaeria bacterium]|nr:hypothetical protein [Lentisphaeria bacterium]